MVKCIAQVHNGTVVIIYILLSACNKPQDYCLIAVMCCISGGRFAFLYIVFPDCCSCHWTLSVTCSGVTQDQRLRETSPYFTTYLNLSIIFLPPHRHTSPEKFYIEACDDGADAVLAIDRVSNEMTLTGKIP